MNILITGGTGLVGRLLTKKLTDRGHTVRILTRTPRGENQFEWNTSEGFIDVKAFENLHSIIHLAGATISKRWTDKYKKELYSSRIDTAQLLLSYCKKLKIHLNSFISASGINYYGSFTADQLLMETDPVTRTDFLAKLCVAWENSAEAFSEVSERVVCLRTAMVLAKTGGAFPLLKKTVDYNTGAAVGSGNQWMNWIHIEDLTDMFTFAVENASLHGKFNAVADELPTNKEFMKKLALQSGKIFLPLHVPSFVMKAAMGEMSTIILEGTRASNKKIKSQGFDFRYPTVDKAFKSLI